MENEFSVYQFFADDSYEEVARFVTTLKAMQTVVRLTRSVGGRLGTTKRIIITDGGDCVVFEWIFGKGVIWPPKDVIEGKEEPDVIH